MTNLFSPRFRGDSLRFVGTRGVLYHSGRSHFGGEAGEEFPAAVGGDGFAGQRIDEA